MKLEVHHDKDEHKQQNKTDEEVQEDREEKQKQEQDVAHETDEEGVHLGVRDDKEQKEQVCVLHGLGS